MKKMVLHQARNRPNRFGGTTFGTLCGRINAASVDGMNVAEDGAEPTCKFCLRQMEIKLRLTERGRRVAIAAIVKAEGQSQ